MVSESSLDHLLVHIGQALLDPQPLLRKVFFLKKNLEAEVLKFKFFKLLIFNFLLIKDLLTWLSVKLKSEQSKLTKENASQLVKPLFGCMGDRSGGLIYLFFLNFFQ